MKELFLMMGAPGSGKSTWINRQLKEGDLYISRDQIRFNLLEPGEEYFAKEGHVFDAFVLSIVSGLKGNFNRVFADASHLNPPSRAKLLNRIKKEYDLKDTMVSVIWMKTPLKTCIERNNLREGRANVPEETITSMWKSQVAPKAKEGINRCYIVNDEDKTINIVLLDSKDENNFIF